MYIHSICLIPIDTYIFTYFSDIFHIYSINNIYDMNVILIIHLCKYDCKIKTHACNVIRDFQLFLC